VSLAENFCSLSRIWRKKLHKIACNEQKLPKARRENKDKLLRENIPNVLFYFLLYLAFNITVPFYVLLVISRESCPKEV